MTQGHVLAGFPGLVLSVAAEADVPAVQELLSATARHLRTRGIDQWPHPFPVGRIRAGFDAGGLFVVRDGHQIVATQSVQDEDAFWPDQLPNVIYAHRLAVAPGYRGLGAAVLRWTEAYAQSLGRSAVRLDCVATNARLRRWYEAGGYEHRGDLAGDGWAVSRYEKALGPPSR